MANPGAALREGRLAIKYTSVSLLGFCTDLALLHVGLSLGAEPAWARLVSLLCAMQVTFVVNGLFVFRSLERGRLGRQWASYMMTNGFGNVCNYWIFVTLVSLHWRIISVPLFAMPVGAVTAWLINYASTRFLVFGKVRAVLGKLRRDP